MGRIIEYADDEVSSVGKLLKLRIPPLILGLILGIGLSVITSRFEHVLSENVKIAYFIPFIVYMADAMGTQTESIYVRNLRLKKAKYWDYFKKETVLGFWVGAICGLAISGFTWLFFGGGKLAWAVGMATFVTILVAPMVALTVVEILESEKTDPAVGAGPIATVIQDTISVVIYGIIASWIML